MSAGQPPQPGPQGGAGRGGLVRSRREASLWLLALAYMGLIFCTLSLVRPLSELLRKHHRLEEFVFAVFGALALLIGVWLVRYRPSWRQLAVLAAVAVLYAALFFYLELPEERIHLPEYGLLAVIFYGALAERRAATPRAAAAPGGGGASWWPALGASLLTAAAGWLDEGIQHLLPSRYYDLRDVVLNAVAGTLAAVTLAALRQLEKKNRHA